MNTMANGNKSVRSTRARHLLIILLGTAAILLVPLVAMQFTRQVNWTGSDFIVAATLLVGTGLLVELASRVLPTRKLRVAAMATIVLGLLFVWAELAVGLVGSPFAGS
jgi:hypothetical protein